MIMKKIYKIFLIDYFINIFYILSKEIVTIN